MLKVNYDEVAPTYDRRYAGGTPPELAKFVEAIGSPIGIGGVLEIGCGTGQWLKKLSHCAQVVGLDISTAMLRRAHERAPVAALIRGCGEELPLRGRCVDRIICINAVHHFDRPQAFIREAWRVLRPGGKLAIVALAPHDGVDRWYLYDHFAGTRDTDCHRYPRTDDLRRWLEETGFANVDTCVAARLQRTMLGSEVLGDPVLSRHGTSQLSLLSDDAFEHGMRSVRAAAESALECTGRTFAVDLRLFGTVGDKQASQPALAADGGGILWHNPAAAAEARSLAGHERDDERQNHRAPRPD